MKKTPTGKALNGFQQWSAGLGRSRPVQCPPKCSPDWTGLVPYLAGRSGRYHIKDRLLKGTDVGGKNFKVHLDGFNQLDYLTGKTNHSARNELYYFNDDGGLVGRHLFFSDSNGLHLRIRARSSNRHVQATDRMLTV